MLAAAFLTIVVSGCGSRPRSPTGPANDQPTTTTLDFDALPFEAAMRKTFEPFGIRIEGPSGRAILWGENLERRRVSLKIENATLWQAFDAFCRASHTALRKNSLLERWLWEFVEEQEQTWPFYSHNSGDAKILIEPWPFPTTPRGYDGKIFLLRVALPIGSDPLRLSIEGLRATDSEGREVEIRVDDASGPWVARRPELPTYAGIPRLFVPAAAANATRTIEIRGGVTAYFVRKLETESLRLEGLSWPATRSLGGTRVTVEGAKLDGEKGRWSVALSWGRSGSPPYDPVLVWLEDAQGQHLRTILKLDPTSEPGRTEIGGTGLTHAAACVIGRVLETDTKSFPFALKDIPLDRR